MTGNSEDNDETAATRIGLLPTSRGRTRNAGETLDRQDGVDVPGEFAAGSQIAGHYRVEAGPLGEGMTGEAEVYRCVDTHTDDTVAVKVYRANQTPNQVVSGRLQGLNHPHIATLHQSTQWQGRVVEVQGYCRGGTLHQHAPYSESELIALLAPLIKALRFCHQYGVVHRDIKPNNLLYRDAERQQVVISDFGISSALDDQEHAGGVRVTDSDACRTSSALNGQKQAPGVRVTDSEGRHTLNYTPPELLNTDQGAVGPMTDYYALGMTLIHLLTRRLPFEGKSDRQIEHAHDHNQIPYPEGLSDAFRRLLRGLTQYDPGNRWGYEQVRAWLDGQPVVDDQGRPLTDDRSGGPAPPYPGYPEARTPKALAAALDHFNAENQLFRGDIRNWIFNHYFGADLAERIEAIQGDYTERRALGVFKLRFVLDRDQPLRVADHEITSLNGLAELLARADEAIQQALEDLLWGEYLETWIEATAAARERSAKLAGDIRATRQRLHQKNRRLALTALAYLLQPR